MTGSGKQHQFFSSKKSHSLMLILALKPHETLSYIWHFTSAFILGSFVFSKPRAFCLKSVSYFKYAFQQLSQHLNQWHHNYNGHMYQLLGFHNCLVIPWLTHTLQVPLATSIPPNPLKNREKKTLNPILKASSYSSSPQGELSMSNQHGWSLLRSLLRGLLNELPGEHRVITKRNLHG